MALFKQGLVNNPKYPTTSSIMAGIAPGGAVAVWVIGSGDRTEVFLVKQRKSI